MCLDGETDSSAKVKSNVKEMTMIINGKINNNSIILWLNSKTLYSPSLTQKFESKFHEKRKRNEREKRRIER